MSGSSRRTAGTWAAFSVVIFLSAMFAWAPGSGPPQDREPGPGEAERAPELPAGHPQTGLPSGHPPVASPGSGPSVLPPLPAGSGTGETALDWEVPAGWVAQQPSSRMRRAQYRIPGVGAAAGDAECIVYYFGPGQGGEAHANAQRWADQFAQPDGRSSREVMRTEELDIGGIRVLTVEIAGTYSGGMGVMGRPAQALDDFMLLGAIARGPDANWFFKLTGPRATVAGQREAFLGLLESLEKG